MQGERVGYIFLVQVPTDLNWSEVKSDRHADSFAPCTGDLLQLRDNVSSHTAERSL